MPSSLPNGKQAEAARYRRRRRHVFKASGAVDAVLVTNRPDIRYLCGSTEGASALLLRRSQALVYTSRMFVVRVTREAPGADVRIPRRGLYKAVRTRLLRGRLCRLGFQQNTMSVAQHRSLCDAIEGTGLELVPVGDVVVEQRAVKDELEIRTIRKAVRIAERAFRELTGQGADYFVGRSELALAGELDYRMRLAGADRQAFPGGTIVASGPNSFNCHHVPTARKVKHGEPVLFDWGAEVAGYRSDITRVVFVGAVHETMREIYEVVRKAHDAAVALMKPGVRCYTVDAAARKIINDAGYAKEFRHGLGHGIGLEVHERPNFGGKPKTGRGRALRKGVVITVEPGVYLEGLGGVRIEDDILVTANGHERLNSLPRALNRMVLR